MGEWTIGRGLLKWVTITLILQVSKSFYSFYTKVSIKKVNDLIHLGKYHVIA